MGNLGFLNNMYLTILILLVDVSSALRAHSRMKLWSVNKWNWSKSNQTNQTNMVLSTIQRLFKAPNFFTTEIISSHEILWDTVLLTTTAVPIATGPLCPENFGCTARHSFDSRGCKTSSVYTERPYDQSLDMLRHPSTTLVVCIQCRTKDLSFRGSHGRH